jgi:hypothetical protein
MNLNILNLTMFGAGAILLYAGITDRNPVNVVKSALQGKIAPKEKG